MKAVNEKLGNFIKKSNKVFIIPPFQRNYSWDEEQCCDLLRDVQESIKKKRSHYIGNIVYYIAENNNTSFDEYVLIDGQQRITSILLLLCAIRNKLSPEDAKRLENEFLFKDGEEKKKYKVKLKQTENDYKIFEKIINYGQISNIEKKKRLYQNYIFFVEQIVDYDEKSALKLFKAIEDLDIVDLNLQIEKDIESVQKIFEKINSTGKPLSVADLVRNYLLISTNSKEQKRLYEKYWVKIEELYEDNEKISDFAKHYLITKRFNWVEEKRLYSIFKLYFDNSEIKKEDILKEMLRYSVYYNWFVDEKCPNKKINIVLKELNLLKSDDMYCLLLILFDKLYENDANVLRKILNLLSDFMIRYRIAAFSNGSGDIRRTISSLLSKIVENNMELTYEKMLYELSNSPSPGGRFPNNDEFKEALKNHVNPVYAKALLYKLEYKTNKNLEVDIWNTRVEHLMPLTLNDTWKRYLGGTSKAILVYNTYLNNIGNIALISGTLKSENSSDKWDKKKKFIADSQFELTKSIDMNCKWDDLAITNRCNKITALALKYITGPIKREREFESIELSEDFTSGVYDVKDIKFKVTGRSIKTVIYNNTPYTIKGWYELVPIICKILFEIDKKKFKTIVKQNKFHKNSFKYSYYFGRDPIICLEDKYLAEPYYIENAECYVESFLSANKAVYYTLELLKEFDVIDKFQLEIE